MLLSEITGNYKVTGITGRNDIPISGIQFDSRKVRPGNLFFAIRGTTFDGHEYIDQAIAKGASAVVCEQLPEVVNDKVTYVVTAKTSAALGHVASIFYGNPSEKLKLIGITGTNGKTTTVTLLYRLFLELGFGAGLISTISNMINQTEIPATYTTPDPVQLNELLARMVHDGCTYCFMEVSSHAIDQQRIAGLSFAGGIFTNLTHDHLDYHKTFDQYLQTKKSFFDHLPESAFALINKDDRNGKVMVQNTQAAKFTYSLQSMSDFRCRIVENRFHGIQLNLDGTEAWFKLIGTFNAYNLLAVYASAVLLGQDKTEILTSLSKMEPVAGRFNYVMSPDQVTAIVDYSHTPDALKNVLETINEIRGRHEQVITVVGAGGNRDVAKRPVMAKIATNLSDRVILTSDNPRNEEPEAILAEMFAGVEIHQEKKVLVIVNRLEAIKTACALAKPGDIILVAGKGHENYQEIKGVRHHFNDKEALQKIFGINNMVNS
ncbi:MAG: UDP-N-acetylmuramoyl-L-alanyl-D-glutamate--2,6-diaminopimelate ligase [Bacteroidales bacterium]|nr:UDP-N-acetylmuramoyl-L-alanyl-D-glutamate--2,6-diaminopimelate ligase [Bacteroidales bacterium]